MKKPDQLQLTWKFDLALRVPIGRKHAATIANRALIAACIVTLTLGLAPLAGLLLAGP